MFLQFCITLLDSEVEHIGTTKTRDEYKEVNFTI
jgi:hypothetical protein